MPEYKKGQPWNKAKNQLMKDFESETSKNAVYHGKITGGFEYWMYCRKGIKTISTRKPRQMIKPFNFTILSKKYIKEYSKKENIPVDYFNIREVNTGKFIRHKTGDAHAIQKGRWIIINPRILKEISTKNPKDAEKMLRYILAHEVAHYKTGESEIFAEQKAVLLSKITQKEFDLLEKKYRVIYRKYYN